MGIERKHVAMPQISIDSVVADAEKVECANFAGGILHLPTRSSVTSLTFHVYSELHSAYHPLYDNTGAATAITVAAPCAVQLPDALFAAGAFKVQGNVDGTCGIEFKS